MSRAKLIPMSQADFDFLTRKRGEPRPKRPRRPKTKAEVEAQPENVLEKQITDFCMSRGWIPIRQHVGTFIPYRVLKNPGSGRPIRIGQLGMADWMMVRAIRPGSSRIYVDPGVAELFYCEPKAYGEKPRPDQLRWLQTMTALGFLAEWFNWFDDEGFEDGGKRSFLSFYDYHFPGELLKRRT